MKKFLKITALIILLLVIFFAAAFKYRQYRANEISIPANASSLAKISVDEIYKSIAANVIANPGFYFKNDSEQDANAKLDGYDHGLKIPGSIYFYTIKNQSKTAFFSRVEIEELYLFEHFLLSKLQLQIAKSGKNGNYSKSKTGNVAVYYNRKYAAIAISNEVINFEPILNDILNQKDFIKVGDSKFSSVKNSTEHVAFADGEQFATLNFDNGAINFSDELISKSIIPAIKPIRRKFNGESAISFWLNADFKITTKQTLKLKNRSAEPDSLFKYFNGYLDFEWLNTTQQTDSIITYDYNDNFEKIEKMTLQKRDIPNIVVNISADAAGLQNYLSRQNFINSASGLVSKSVFPLYKIFVGGNSKQLILSTSKGNKVRSNTTVTSDFFALKIDFTKLNEQLNQPLLTRYSKNLALLEVKGNNQENGKIKIDGKLAFVNKDINSLYQLLKGF